jgi:hypothetical protein
MDVVPSHGPDLCSVELHWCLIIGNVEDTFKVQLTPSIFLKWLTVSKLLKKYPALMETDDESKHSQRNHSSSHPISVGSI